jgi:AbrB family looped-hinge helix DNA binding protein
MQEFRTKMASNGRIIIPAAIRRLLDLMPGEELVLHVENHELRVISLKYSLKKAKAVVKRHAKNKSLVNELKKMRHEDAESES